MLWKVIQNKISGWKNPENLFSIRNIHYAWLLKAKNRLFNPGQNFCPGQFKYCPGQKIFCPGRWMRHKSKFYGMTWYNCWNRGCHQFTCTIYSNPDGQTSFWQLILLSVVARAVSTKDVVAVAGTRTLLRASTASDLNQSTRQ